MEYHTHLLTEALVKKGVRVTLITTAHPEGLLKETLNGVDIYYLDHTLPRSYSNEWWELSLKKFKKLHAKNNFDIVHSQSIGAWGLLEHITSIKLPLVTTSHGTPISDASSYVRSNRLGVEVFTFLDITKYLPKHYQMYRNSNKVIAVSDELNKHISGFFFKRSKNIVTVLNGIDTSRFNPDIDTGKIREKYSFGQEDKIILFVGRIIKEKGVQNIISALPLIRKQFEDVKLLIVGDGNYLPEVRNLVKGSKCSSSITVTGRVDADDIPFLYNLADVFVSPTLRVEGLPYNLLEAMSTARPVVASDMGGISDLINTGEDGILIPAGNINSLAAEVTKLLEDPGKAAKLGKKARVKINKKFSTEKMTDETLAIYDEIVK
jgi:glycosyltransferase involved in cell wall biosynthesis